MGGGWEYPDEDIWNCKEIGILYKLSAEKKFKERNMFAVSNLRRGKQYISTQISLVTNTKENYWWWRNQNDQNVSEIISV